MSVTTVGVTHGVQASSVNVVFTKPAGVQVGDLLICAAGLGFGGGVQSYTPPSGFTQYADVSESSLSLSAPLFYKIADGSEASTFTAVGAHAGQGGVGCCAYRGVHQVTPILAVGPITDDSGGSGPSTTVQAVSWAGATRAISMILIVSQKLSVNPVVTFPAGWNAVTDGFTDNDGLIWCSFGVNLTSNLNAVGLPSQTASFAGNTVDANAQFAIQDAQTGLQLELGPLARRFA